MIFTLFRLSFPGEVEHCSPSREIIFIFTVLLYALVVLDMIISKVCLLAGILVSVACLLACLGNIYIIPGVL